MARENRGTSQRAGEDSLPSSFTGATLSRVTEWLYLASLALLPWAAVPAFPWLHPRAQWSDLVFALAAALWAADLWRRGVWPKLGAAHAGMAQYLVMATLSLLFADPRPPSGAAKLLGLGLLAAMAVVSADVIPRIGVAVVARTIAATTLASAAAALLGVGLFFAGVATPFVGRYGDLVPGDYARAQAGLPHPNLLASFCVFAYGVVARNDAGLSLRFRRLTTSALVLTSLLTFSRGTLALALAFLVHHADTRRRRRRTALASVLFVTLLATLNVTNVRLDPTRPWEIRLLETPSSRRQALTSSLVTLREHPWFGTGPGTSPGAWDGYPWDAHCTVLNVAATLGLPALAGLLLVPIALWRSRPRPTDLATWGMLAGFGLESVGHDVEDFRHVWVAFGLAAVADVRGPTASDGSTLGQCCEDRPSVVP